MALHTYLPQDRLRALANSASLPDRTRGSALFADISGFTLLTEKFTREYGARRGVEELTHMMNNVYDALITQVERHGGSVISFAGDAITCWFDEKRTHLSTTPAPTLAVLCAFALQTAMKSFPQLAVKVAVATGEARRFVVGDPNNW